MSSFEKKIKVLQIVRAPIGGIRKHIVTIVEALEKSKEFDWYWITSMETGDVDEGFKSFLKSSGDQKVTPLKIKDQPELRDLKNIIILLKIFKKNKIDIIHGHGAKGGLYARILGFLIGAQVVYTPHGGSLHDMFGKVKGALYSLIEIILYPLTDLYLFESKYSMQQFEKKVTKSKKKVVLNRNGITLPEFKPALKKGKEEVWILGSFGALRHIKGHDIIIKALADLQMMGIRCEYHIYGEGEEKQNLLNLACDLKLSDQLKIFEKTKDIFSAMETCDIVIQPSRHESFGYVPLEAMAIGRPVISSNQGGLKEIIAHENDGLMVSDFESMAFAHSIKRLMEDEALRNRLVINGRKKVETEFSESQMLETIQECYKALVLEKK